MSERQRRVRALTSPVERVFIYCRISEDPRQKELGVKRQEKDCRALAAARGWEVVDVFVDNDIAVLRAGAVRSGYQALLAAVQRGDVTRVVAYGLSRLWRNRRERADAIDLLRAHRVSVTLVRGADLDLTSAAGRMVAGVVGEADTMESELKAERVADAALDRAERGLANGHVAYGWRRVRTRNALGEVIDWQDEIDPEQAAIVREIVDRLLDEESIKAIVADLNARQVAPPRAALRAVNGRPGAPDPNVPTLWRPSTVRKLALRAANAGRICRGREDFGPAQAPAIVDPEVHAQVVALLTDPSRATSRSGARKHLLTFGIGECGVCGSRLRSKTYHRNRARNAGAYTAYHCDSNAGCVSRRADLVDELVQRVVVERLARPDARDLLVRDDGAATAARQHAESLRAKLAQTQDDYDTDLITRDMYLRSTTRHRAALVEAEAECLRAVRGVAPALVARMAGPQAQAEWDQLNTGQRRALLDALGVVVAILPTRRRGPGFDPETVRITFRDDAAEQATA